MAKNPPPITLDILEMNENMTLDDKVLAQTQSPLFGKLPAEIRRLIYAALFTGHPAGLCSRMLHIKMRQEFVGPSFTRGWQCDALDQCSQPPRLTLCRGSGFPDDDNGPYVYWRKDRVYGFVGLLASCWRVYLEASRTLYSTTGFSISPDYGTRWPLQSAVATAILFGAAGRHLCALRISPLTFGSPPLGEWLAICQRLDTLSTKGRLHTLQIDLLMYSGGRPRSCIPVSMDRGERQLIARLMCVGRNPASKLRRENGGTFVVRAPWSAAVVDALRAILVDGTGGDYYRFFEDVMRNLADGASATFTLINETERLEPVVL